MIYSGKSQKKMLQEMLLEKKNIKTIQHIEKKYIKQFENGERTILRKSNYIEIQLNSIKS